MTMRAQKTAALKKALALWRDLYALWQHDSSFGSSLNAVEQLIGKLQSEPIALTKLEAK